MPSVEEVAESTPAESPEPQTPEAPEPVGIFDKPKETAPAEAPKAEESAPSKDTPESKDESVTASEAAERSGEEKGESKAERRIKQLTAEKRALEREVAQYRQPTNPQQTHQFKEPVRPDLESFNGTAEEYKAALEAYDKEARQFAVYQDRLARQAEESRNQQAKVEAEARTAWEKRAERITKANPEFDAVKSLQVVQPNATTDGFLVDSDVGPEILNYLYENPDEADRIRELAPYKAIRALVALENRFSDQIKGIKPKSAPKPPPAVSGRAGAPAAPKTAADVLYG